jgi:hypothetical protein
VRLGRLVLDIPPGPNVRSSAANAGLMDLVYLGDIAQKPQLNDAFYESLFRRPNVYRAEPRTSKAMGDEVTTFRVFRD